MRIEVLSGCLILNRIQTLCLFKEAFSKAFRYFNQQAHASLEEPMPPSFSSPSLLPWRSNAQAWASSIFNIQRCLGVPYFLLIFSSWFLYNLEKKSKRRKEEKDQEKDQRVDRDPSFIQIRRLIFLRDKKSISKRAILGWSWVNIHRGRIFV